MGFSKELNEWGTYLVLELERVQVLWTWERGKSGKFKPEGNTDTLGEMFWIMETIRDYEKM